MKLKSSRRQFLKDASDLAATAGMMYGLDGLFQILMQNAVANAATSNYPYNYVNLLTAGGPPRWFFDQPLNPYNRAAEFVPGAFGTIIKKSGNEWQASHLAKKVKFGGKDVYMPPVWSLKQGGTGTAFADLLNDCIMIRGLNMEINSHDVNRERTIRPVNATPSISGLVAEAAGKPITSLGHEATQTSKSYKSADGSSSVMVNRANPIVGITSPFNVSQIVKYDDLDYSVQRALDAIDDYAKDNNLTSQGNQVTLKNSFDMFARNLSKFTTDYKKLYDKYNAIVTKEAKAEFPQVTTDLKSIKPDGSAKYQYFSGGRTFGSTDKLNKILSTAAVPTMAHTFALAEFALKEKLTSSLTLEMGGNFSNIKGVGISQDQHFIGEISSTIFTNLYFRCVLGCMIEFRRALTALKIWDKTLVHMASEFSRTPATSGRGSDHGFESGSTSLFGGMMKKPGLIGNIYTTPGAAFAPIYAGTWGHAAPHLEDPQTGKMRNIINDDVVKTICEILQIPKLGTKGVSLVKNKDGKVELLPAYAKFANMKRT